MKSNKRTGAKSKASVFRWSNVLVCIVNIVLLPSVFILYSSYMRTYDERLREENLVNIANLNQSAALNATALFDGWETKLDDIARYVELHDLTHSETFDMISDTNSCDERYFELIGSDHTGFLAKKDGDGSFPTLDYSSSSYSPLHKVFDNYGDGETGEICFAPEYTDAGESATKFFALYKHISLKTEGGE